MQPENDSAALRACRRLPDDSIDAACTRRIACRERRLFPRRLVDAVGLVIVAIVRAALHRATAAWGTRSLAAHPGRERTRSSSGFDFREDTP